MVLGQSVAVVWCVVHESWIDSLSKNDTFVF